MNHFAVIRGRGTAWDASREMREQDRWEEHARFMDKLAAEGFLILGGPLGDGERILLVVEAESERAVYARLEGDPWTPLDLLRVTSVEPWEILLRG